MEVNMATKLSQIIDYYGTDTIWNKMSINGLSADQINAMYNSLPASSFTVDRTASGLVMGRNYANPFELPVIPGTDFDSNISGGSYGGGNTFTGNIPANLVLDPTTGVPVSQFSGPTTSNGSVLPAVADRVSLAVMGVNIGAKLGMAIDDALYSLNPSWWDENLPAINPQTWNSLVGVNPAGDFFLRTLFGITGDNMTGYVSEDVLAYYYQMLRDAGIYSTEGYTATLTNRSRLPSTYANIESVSVGDGTFSYVNRYNQDVTTYVSPGSYGYCYQDGPNNITVVLMNNSPITGTKTVVSSDGHTTQTPISYTQSDVTYNTRTTFYTLSLSLQTANPHTTPPEMSKAIGSNTRAIATYLYDGTVVQEGGVDGIQPMPNATQYPPTNITGTTPQQVKQQLKQEYPDLFTDAITERTLQDDGTVTETTYVPIPWATTGIDGEEKITDEGKTQDTTQVDEETSQQILPQTTPDDPTDPPDTGEGSTPVPAVPAGSASSLWAVYNPTQAELNSFGAWLWSSDFVEQLKKLFADPMQAIIGVHKVFATPSTGGSQTIKCGYLDSGVSSAVVTNQYSTVDCGSASLREYFGNVFDYDPFTKVSIFLPFIGIVPLNTADVMRSTVSVKYKVDVITGACLAEVSVSRDGGGGILYTYGGSAIVTYPVSSGSYVGVVQAALSTAIGIGSAIASGGASLGASAGMVLGGLSHAKTQVQHSGQFSGSSGAMGGKKPYLIISRPQTRTPQRIGEYEGIPTNSIHQLSTCTGFTKVKEVHITSKTAYDNEIQEIESLLKTGVII